MNTLLWNTCREVHLKLVLASCYIKNGLHFKVSSAANEHRILLRSEHLIMILTTTNNQFRSSHQRCSVRKSFLENFSNFTYLQACNLVKKRIQHLRNFWEHLFWRVSADDYFYMLRLTLWEFVSRVSRDGINKNFILPETENLSKSLWTNSIIFLKMNLQIVKP